VQLDPDPTCQTCGRRFVVPATRRGPPRRTCSRSCAARCPRRHVPLVERFWRHVQRTESCWLWTGCHTESGAGILPVRQGGKVQRLTAARVAWELFVGPVPPGRRLWRRCRRPACVRPDHLVLVRRGRPEAAHSEPDAVRDTHRAARPDARRTWWTRERVLAGLVAFHRATGKAPTTSRNWAGVIQRIGRRQQRFPTAYAVLRHFPNFRAAWNAAGIQLPDAHWAPWTAEHDRYIVTYLGVQPTIAIAAALGRGEPAVRSRARKLGLRVGNARGWPILRVARTAGISEYVLRAYVRRGELPAFKGAKHVYLDPADLVVVAEIDWQHPSAELETAALHSLRRRLVMLLASRSGAPRQVQSRLLISRFRTAGIDMSWRRAS
jgi:hypothetical protein